MLNPVDFLASNFGGASQSYANIGQPLVHVGFRDLSPAAWFAVFEAGLYCHSIHTDDAKYFQLLSHLPTQWAQNVWPMYGPCRVNVGPMLGH